jgi:hypothetical protein
MGVLAGAKPGGGQVALLSRKKDRRVRRQCDGDVRPDALVPDAFSALRSQFPDRAQKADDVVAAQHPHYLVFRHHRELIDAVAVHQLERGP